MTEYSLNQAGWNIFDFVIVALSAAETALDIFATTLANSMWGSDALSVVRTMRLARALRGVRFFRLFRHFSALRALILSIAARLVVFLLFCDLQEFPEAAVVYG